MSGRSAGRPALAVVDLPSPRGPSWADRARALEDRGVDALLVPDVLAAPAAAVPALAAAAAVTSRLRLRTWVLAAPLHPAAAVVHDAASLQLLSGGRFELGLGVGRPDAANDAAALGARWGTGAERLAAVEAVAAAVRAAVAPVPLVAVAAGGPRGLALAGRTADLAALAAPPAAREEDVAGLAAEVARAAAAAGRPSPGLSWQLTGAGDRVPTHLARSGLSADALRAAGAAGLLPGGAQAGAEHLDGLLQRLRLAELVVPAECLDAVLPAWELLA